MKKSKIIKPEIIEVSSYPSRGFSEGNSKLYSDIELLFDATSATSQQLAEFIIAQEAIINSQRNTILSLETTIEQLILAVTDIRNNVVNLNSHLSS